MRAELLAFEMGTVRNGNVTSVGAPCPHEILTWDYCALGGGGGGHQALGVQEGWEHHARGVQEGFRYRTLGAQGGWSPYTGGAGEWSTCH